MKDKMKSFNWNMVVAIIAVLSVVGSVNSYENRINNNSSSIVRLEEDMKTKVDDDLYEEKFKSLNDKIDGMSEKIDQLVTQNGELINFIMDIAKNEK